MSSMDKLNQFEEPFFFLEIISLNNESQKWWKT